MTKAARSSTSASSVALGLALTALLVVALDQGGGALLDRIYGRSTASPIGRIALAAPRTLVLGSSTGKTAIDPAAFLPATYNAAENGQSLFYVAAVMRNLPRLERLERVVIAFDPADLVSGYRSGNLKHLWRVAPLGRGDVLVRQWLALDDPWVAAKLHSGLFPYRGGLDAVIYGWWRPRLDGDGFLALEGQQDAATPGPPPAGAPVPVRPEAARALAAILDAARRLDVRLVALVTPMSGRLRETEPRLAEAVALIRRAFAASGHCDLTTAGPKAFADFAATPAYFWEGPHMNAAGAAAYSRRLAALIAEECGDAAGLAGRAGG